MPMTHRLAAVLAFSLLASCLSRGTVGAPAAPPAGEFRDTHRGLLRGTVLNGRGEPLEGVEVAAVRLADPSVASLAYGRAWTDAAGSFTLPLGMIAHARTDTATVRVVVRAAAFPPRYPRPSPDAYYTTEAIAGVRITPTGREPAPTSVRLVLPIP
ncbi:MAG TPA: hypothetical protein VFR81_30710 [Longimicrobium sp.]|nr:hypothetical protein [Longimicrobium sp.]